MNKADKVRAFFANNPGGSRKDAAAFAGCSVQRVGEVVRQSTNTDHIPPEAEDAFYAIPAGPDDLSVEVRHAACEHERRRKTRRGTCTECPPFVLA
jgi:hypothetical protein